MVSFSEFNFKGKTALVRVDFNVPIDIDLKIKDYTKISISLPTINKIIKDEGRVILMSHLGRPKGEKNYRFSLKPIFEYLSKIYGGEVLFSEINDDVKNLKGKIILLENLRFFKEEENSDVEFAKKLSKLGDVYVNDAFASIHRGHSSLIQLPKLFKEKFLGFSLQNEINKISIIENNTKPPLTVIVGGKKVFDKILPLKEFLEKAENILLGGVVANTFLKAKGGSIGMSDYEEESINLAKDIIEICNNKNVNLIFPIDFVVIESDLESREIWPSVVLAENISDNQKIMDIGPETKALFTDFIEDTKSVFWSGPMGYIENEAFIDGTNYLLNALHDFTKKGGFSVIGGGETGYLANKLQKNVGYISSGGSALLEYIAKKKQLPAVWW